MNRELLAQKFTLENLLREALDGDTPVLRKLLEISLEGVREVILNHPAASFLSDKNTYHKFEILDNLTDGYVARLLSDNGLASWTGCPECCVDDFTHVQGCTTSYYQ